MIPKKIHYCWFGGKEIPKHDRKCIESWKKYCPDYEIIEWNDTNYDLSKSEYMNAAYKEKKMGFVPDYARYDIVYTHGGIYMDTDVEIIRSLDDLLDNKAFMGFEGGLYINGGMGFGAEARNTIVLELRDMYNNISFYNEDGSLNLKPSPFYITDLLIKKGLKQNDTSQNIDGVEIYPTEFFSPKNYESGKINVTPNTFSIHHYNASWTSPGYKFRIKFIRLIGQDNFKRLAKIKKRIIK